GPRAGRRARCPTPRRRRPPPPPRRRGACPSGRSGRPRPPPWTADARWSRLAASRPSRSGPPRPISVPDRSPRDAPSRDLIERLRDFGDDAGWKRDVPELLAELLAVAQPVLDDALEGVLDLRVRVLLVRQEPRVGDDGIGRRRARIGDPRPQVGRQLDARQCGFLALEVGLHVLAALVLEGRHGHLRLLGVAVLDVADPP